MYTMGGSQGLCCEVAGCGAKHPQREALPALHPPGCFSSLQQLEQPA